jgi:hypothetical protein
LKWLKRKTARKIVGCPPPTPWKQIPMAPILLNMFKTSLNSATRERLENHVLFVSHRRNRATVQSVLATSHIQQTFDGVCSVIFASGRKRVPGQREHDPLCNVGATAAVSHGRSTVQTHGSPCALVDDVAVAFLLSPIDNIPVIITLEWRKWLFRTRRTLQIKPGERPTYNQQL